MSMQARLVLAEAGIEAQLKTEVAELMAMAEAADKADIPDGISIPDELARREERLQKLSMARTKACPREGGDRGTRQGALRTGAG